MLHYLLHMLCCVSSEQPIFHLWGPGLLSRYIRGMQAQSYYKLIGYKCMLAFLCDCVPICTNAFQPQFRFINLNTTQKNGTVVFLVLNHVRLRGMLQTGFVSFTPAWCYCIWEAFSVLSPFVLLHSVPLWSTSLVPWEVRKVTNKPIYLLQVFLAKVLFELNSLNFSQWPIVYSRILLNLCPQLGLWSVRRGQERQTYDVSRVSSPASTLWCIVKWELLFVSPSSAL